MMSLSFTIPLLILASMANAILPYQPTTALVSSNSSAVYIFGPSHDGSTFQLSAIALTSTITASNTGSSIIASSLPFTPQPTTALIVTIDAEDRIHLVAGDCSNGIDGASLYTISPLDPSPQWRQISISVNGVLNPTANGGINALSGPMQFNDKMYIFGGMCPNSSTLSVDNWQASGAYSNALLSISAEGSVEQLVTRGPPIPEAGFSVTPLQAAYQNHSVSVASQQSFVLIGGQLQTAFINTSQIAIFSLPGESWAFAPVDASSISPYFDPRSGHAAALSSDGQKILVSGGWVGDVNTPAEPQFLALNIDSNYGGTGEWSWSEPHQSGSAPRLYGHSMVSLPGDVLMVVGGYTLPATAAKLGKRDSGPNTMTYFYNTSSSTWSTEYTNPETLIVQGSQSNNGLKVGLGVGLGLGLGLLLIIGVCLWFGRRKIREHRRNRDRRLLQQSLNAANGPQPLGTESGPSMTQRNPPGGDPYPWAPVHGDPDSVRRASQAERTGLSYEIPSPTRGLRRSLHSRPSNASYEDGRRSRGAGHIHTIAESDENEKVHHGMDHDIIATAPILDPFQDPIHLLDRRSPSPTSPAHEREVEMQHWYNDWAEAERQQNSGRTSPNKSDRTSSTLSDSNRSIVSALSYQTSLKRNGSKKSTPQISPPDTPVTATHRRKRSKSFGLGQRSTESFPRIQAEGHALLGGPSALTPGEPSSKPVSKPKGILGSVRRAFGGDRPILVTPPERSATITGRVPRGTGEDGSPQRSSSLGTMTYSQRRQGAQDWGENSSPPKSLSGDAHHEEEDWDVESAVERRVVQVMFTVPRGALRVVNAGLENDAISVPEAQSPLLEEAEEEGETHEDKDKGKQKAAPENQEDKQ